MDKKQLIQEQLDAILTRFSTKHPIEGRYPPMAICEKAKLLVDRDTAYMLVEKLAKDGYFKNPEGNFYEITLDGIIFIENGGYIIQHYVFERERRAKKISDYVDMFAKPIGLLGVLVATAWAAIQILKALRILN